MQKKSNKKHGKLAVRLALREEKLFTSERLGEFFSIYFSHCNGGSELRGGKKNCIADINSK